MDLNILTKDELYLEKAYEIALGNVNVLVDEQRTLNKTYMEEIQKIEADKDSTKREKEEIKKYNKLLKEQRKVELPPVSEILKTAKSFGRFKAEKIRCFWKNGIRMFS